MPTAAWSTWAGPTPRRTCGASGSNSRRSRRRCPSVPGLARSVAVARKDDSGQQRLIAYVVPAGGQTLSAEDLRRYAAGRLPEAMVPSVFMVLERLPLGADGRLDRAALPEPTFDDASYRAPRNDTERVLAAAFADVLELDRVGIDQDFFDLGGNSLRAIRLVSVIRTELKQEVSIRTLFAARTIAGLSDMWKDLAQSSRPTPAQEDEGRRGPLSEDGAVC
ncbi:phosphopantetheine-binding protein [Streptomyces sp. PmtG]